MLFLGTLSVSAKENTARYKIRWLLAYEPTSLFQDVAASFSNEVSLKTNGDIEVEILTLADYQRKYDKSRQLRNKPVADYIQDGKAEMTQAYTTELGLKNNQLWVLDLPFLFRSHEHAQKVL